MVLRKDFSLADTHTVPYRLWARLWQSQAFFPTASSCGALAEEGGVPGNRGRPAHGRQEALHLVSVPTSASPQAQQRVGSCRENLFRSPIAKIHPCLSRPSEGSARPPHTFHPPSPPSRVACQGANRCGKGKAKEQTFALTRDSPHLYIRPEPLLEYTLQSGWHMGSHGDPQSLLSPEEAGVEEEALGEEGECPWRLG